MQPVSSEVVAYDRSGEPASATNSSAAMQASPRTFHQLFTTDVQYEIPVFQRQYVWTKSKQLEPLWDDIRSVADRALTEIDGNPEQVSRVDTGVIEGHFLGAIVLDDTSHRLGVNARPVIDGQQRLTTLQLLISAIREVAKEMGLTNQDKMLADLLFHPEHQIEDAPEHHRYRVWPTLHDREAFRLVVDTHGPDHLAAADYGEHRMASAEAYFREQIEAWAAELGESPELRLRVLVRVIQRLLRVVVIELDETDNAQLIFETLNARGEDLLAAELVKNFLFQRAEQPGVDIVGLYQETWEKFEGGVWRKLIGVGRRKRPRVEQFLFYWLTMQTADEVSPDHLFPAFRRWAKETDADAVAALREFSRDGATHLAFQDHPDGTVEQRFFKRLDILDTNTPIPLVLWLHREPSGVPVERRQRALSAIESWLVRRALCRYTTRGYNQFFLELLAAAKAATSSGSDELDKLVVDEFRSKADTPSRSWPTDAELRDALYDRPLYGPVNQRRVRMVLIAIEDYLRDKTGGKAEKIEQRDRLHIEHLLPQSWYEHWTPAAQEDGDSPAALEQRQEWIESHEEHRNLVLHSLGNLTLLTEPLNTSVSNGPWPAKRSSIDEYSAFRLNREIVLRHGADGWDEQRIAARTEEMLAAIQAIWPGPECGEWDV